MLVSGLQTEIFETVYFRIVHLSFLTSHNLLFFSLCKTSKKTTFSAFLSYFSRKIVQISISVKLNISRTAWPILIILVSFCRILNGLFDEINLFWCCSSPLMFYKSLISGLHISRKDRNHMVANTFFKLFTYALVFTLL